MTLHRISYGPDPNQFGDLRIPETPPPHSVVVFIHGGFWRSHIGLTRTDAACEALAGSGIATWNLEYRRMGQPGGGWPGTAEDVLAGCKHLRSLFGPWHLDPTRVIIAGHSAGGHLALWTAAQDAVEIRGVISLAGVSDLRYAWELQLGSGVAGEFIGGSPEDFPAQYSAASPIELLPIRAPQIMIHGTADTIVPFSMSRRFAERSANAEVVPLVGTGHQEVIDPNATEWQGIQRSITLLLEST